MSVVAPALVLTYLLISYVAVLRRDYWRLIAIYFDYTTRRDATRDYAVRRRSRRVSRGVFDRKYIGRATARDAKRLIGPLSRRRAAVVTNTASHTHTWRCLGHLASLLTAQTRRHRSAAVHFRSGFSPVLLYSRSRQLAPLRTNIRGSFGRRRVCPSSPSTSPCQFSCTSPVRCLRHVPPPRFRFICARYVYNGRRSIDLPRLSDV